MARQGQGCQGTRETPYSILAPRVQFRAVRVAFPCLLAGMGYCGPCRGRSRTTRSCLPVVVESIQALSSKLTVEMSMVSPGFSTITGINYGVRSTVSASRPFFPHSSIP